MNKIKRKLLPLLLALVMLLGTVPATAAGSFSDISDMATAQNVEVLQMMGVVDGMSGSTFVPNGTLTRAQFCKMAVAAMGQGDRANIYKNYTIFVCLAAVLVMGLRHRHIGVDTTQYVYRFRTMDNYDSFKAYYLERLADKKFLLAESGYWLFCWVLHSC